MIDVFANGHSAEDNLVAFLLGQLTGDDGPVVIQAGHFLLLGDQATTKCVPGVCEELEGNGKVDESYVRRVSARIGVFPSATWQLGTRLAVRLREAGRAAFLTTIVNDWQYLPRLRTGEAADRRRNFYSGQPHALQSYLRTLRSHGLDGDAITHLGGHGAFLSEYWLRRRLERHLKGIKRAKGAGSEHLHWDKDEEGNSCLMLDEPDGKKCLLECGQSDCAGEVMEMLYLAESKGFRSVVSFVPAECERPVNEGTRRAMSVFQLANLRVTNVALSCAGEQSMEEVLKQPRSVHTFHAIRAADSRIQIEARSTRG